MRQRIIFHCNHPIIIILFVQTFSLSLSFPPISIHILLRLVSVSLSCDKIDCFHFFTMITSNWNIRKLNHCLRDCFIFSTINYCDFFSSISIWNRSILFLHIRTFHDSINRKYFYGIFRKGIEFPIEKLYCIVLFSIGTSNHHHQSILGENFNSNDDIYIKWGRKTMVVIGNVK